MATKSKTLISKGTCNFCQGEVDKAKMTQHFKHCKQRAAAIARSMADETKQKQKLFHILVEGRYNPQYWMHLELPASEPLATLDGFLRDIWLECCNHLSTFEIDGTSYSDEPEEGDFSFDSIEFVEEGAEGEEGEWEDEEEEEELVEEEDEEEGEEEDLSPEEMGAAIGQILDEMQPQLRDMLSAEIRAELIKPRSRDELVAFLKENLKALPGRPMPPLAIMLFGISDTQEMRDDIQKSLLKALLDEVEDRTLYVPLEKVLQVGQKFKHEYDFGSSTHLNLRVIAERDGVVQEDEEDDSVTILARNLPPAILCKVCGEPATLVPLGGYFNVEENAYCDKCADQAEDSESMLPVVNSPRVGVCAYTG